MTLKNSSKQSDVGMGVGVGEEQAFAHSALGLRGRFCIGMGTAVADLEGDPGVH
jgi:hypothetical protein